MQSIRKTMPVRICRFAPVLRRRALPETWGLGRSRAVFQGETRRATLARQFSRVIEAIRRGDDDAVQELVLG